MRVEQTVPIFTVSSAQFNSTCNSSSQTPSNRPKSLSVRRVEEYNLNIIHLPLCQFPVQLVPSSSGEPTASWKANT